MTPRLRDFGSQRGPWFIHTTLRLTGALDAGGLVHEACGEPAIDRFGRRTAAVLRPIINESWTRNGELAWSLPRAT
jgi:hypothetical protein